MHNLRKFSPEELAALDAADRAFEGHPEKEKHMASLREGIRAGWLDSKLKSFGNARAYAQHLQTNSNRGFHVHMDLNDFGKINKAHGDQVGDDALFDFERIVGPIKDRYKAKSFRPGGDEFKFHFNDADSAHGFVRELAAALDKENGKRQFGSVGKDASGNDKVGYNLAASIGIGVTPDHAEQSLMKIKGTLGERKWEPHPTTGEMVLSDKRLNYHPEGQSPTIYWSGVANAGVGSPFAKKQPGAPAITPTVSPEEKTSPMEVTQKSERLHKALDNRQGNVVQSPQGDGRMPADHPILSNKKYAILTADQPKFAQSVAGGGDALKELIQQQGYVVEEGKGRYDQPRSSGVPHERSFIVHGATPEDAQKWGAMFGQEAILYSENGKHHLLYVNGPHANTALITDQMRIVPTEPDDYYTEFNFRGKPVWFQMDFGNSKKQPNPFPVRDTVEWVNRE